MRAFEIEHPGPQAVTASPIVTAEGRVAPRDPDRVGLVVSGGVRVVLKRDRRNAFARTELLDAVYAHFHKSTGLVLTMADATSTLQLNATLCERLLTQLVDRGCLVREPSGFHAAHPAVVV